MTDYPLSPVQVAALMRASTAAAAAEVRALGSLATARPAPDEWCANEVVGHLLEADRRGFVGRVRALLDTPGITFELWDQPVVAAARHDELRDPGELVAELLAERSAGIELVEGLAAADLDQVGGHPMVGDLTIGNLIHEWVFHDRDHGAQLTSISRSLAWAGMGNAQRFSGMDA